MKNIKNRRNIKNYGTESELPFIYNKHALWQGLQRMDCNIQLFH
jgi:hypothetical protein